jgi:hypothetical protein
MASYAQAILYIGYIVNLGAVWDTNYFGYICLFGSTPNAVLFTVLVFPLTTTASNFFVS